jgi:hypothetical protein
MIRYLYINKKFWEEIITYFPLIRHGPVRKKLGGSCRGQGGLISLLTQIRGGCADRQQGCLINLKSYVVIYREMDGCRQIITRMYRHRQQGDFLILHLFFQNKGSRLKQY